MDFYQFLKSMHGYLAIMACVLIVVLALITVFRYFSKKEITDFYRRFGLYTLITFHLQLLVGLALLFSNSTLLNSLGYKIQNKVTLMEHLPSNLTVVLLVTFFYSRLKRKKKVSLTMLLVILVSVILLGRTYLLLSGVIQR